MVPTLEPLGPSWTPPWHLSPNELTLHPFPQDTESTPHSSISLYPGCPALLCKWVHMGTTPRPLKFFLLAPNTPRCEWG